MPITDCLNVGCGSVRFFNAVNLDKTHVEKEVEPDILADAIILPFKDDLFKNVLAAHIIEHLIKEHHSFALNEWWRVLIPNGKLFIIVPEFELCLKNYLDNYLGQKEWWYDTIFGANRYAGDRHLSGLTRQYLTDKLFDCGFGKLVWTPPDRGFALMKVVATKTERLPGRI